MEMETIKSDIEQHDAKKNGFSTNNTSPAPAALSSQQQQQRVASKKQQAKKRGFWGKLCTSGKSD